MNIALIGTPGSGKSELAEALSAELDGKVGIVDDYVAAIEDKTQLALGPISGYLGNLYVALERYALENTERQHCQHVITCGTLIETAVYLAMHFVSLANVLSDKEKAEAVPQIDAVLRMFAVLYNDVMRYDHVFYLPPTRGDDETKFIDQQIQAGLEGFKLVEVTVLPEPKARVQDVLKALSEVPAA